MNDREWQARLVDLERQERIMRELHDRAQASLDKSIANNRAAIRRTGIAICLLAASMVFWILGMLRWP